MNMSAKLLKSQSQAIIGRFVLPELGSAAPAYGITNFTFPAVGIETQSSESVFYESPQPDSILSNAEAQATQIISQAEENAALIEQAAHDKGLAQAEARISAEVAAQVSDLREELTESIAKVSDLYGVMAIQAERELVELALEIAKKIVQREVSIDREVALTLARVTLGRLHNRSAAALHLHPEDCAYVSANLEKLNFYGAVELIEDRSISPGSCLVRTEMGDIDARIEQQFEEISRGLLSKK